MPVKKYCDLETLQYYDSKWLLRFEAMEINNNDIDNLLFDNMGIVPTLPTSWTESANGTLDLSLSNAYSYWPEGAGAKTVSIANGTTSGLSKFFLKLTDAGNFPMQWGSNIQWKNGSEPVWQAFNEDIIMFTSNNGGSTWTGQVLQTNAITPYWKFTANVSDNKSAIPFGLYNTPNTTFYVDWGDGTNSTLTSSNYSEIPYYNDEPSFNALASMHTYSSSGIYTITVRCNDWSNVYLLQKHDSCDGYDSGDLENNISSNYISNTQGPLRVVYYWRKTVDEILSPLPPLKGTAFYEDDPEDTIDWLYDKQDNNITLYYSAFSTIPDKFFNNFKTVTSFYYCFYGCSLTSIPDNLFKGMYNITNFGSCFKGCENLSVVNLYIDSPNVSSWDNFINNDRHTIHVPANSTSYTNLNFEITKTFNPLSLVTVIGE